ncbi:hypothetical protein [Alteraurantiacibacter palmitatis]|uniref:Gene transfer agent family protein n=1 Tax=Alteraurantiacibacter palmitatis TaxID=2054628 RepID=A0ABV7E661_9SPHN
MTKVDMVNGRANRLQGEAQFTYEGRAYKISINNRALFEAESVLGESMLDFGNAILEALQAGRNPMMKHVCAIVYGGLVINHPEITEDDVIDMVMSGDNNVRRAIYAAMQGVQTPASAPAEAGNAPATATPKASGTGKRSTKAGAKPASNRPASGGKRRSR